MRLDAGTLNDFKRFASAVARGLRNGLTLSDNVQCSIVDVADTGAADAAFTVNHNLGKVPVAYFWNSSLKGFVYDSNRAGWTNTQMELKCSIANSALKLVIF